MASTHLWRFGHWLLWLLVPLALVAVGGITLFRTGRNVALDGSKRGSAGSRAAIARAQGFLEQGQPKLAIQAVSTIRAGDAEEGRAWTIRGLALASLNQLEDSRRALERGWKLTPDPMAAKVLAALYLTASEPARALQMLHAAAEMNPADFRPWYAMGDTHLRLDRPQEAAQAFREALKRLPDNDESRIGLIDALLRSSQPAEAAPLLEDLLRTHGDDPQLLLLAAHHARETGHADTAARFVDRTLAQDPENPRALLLRAQLLHRAGKLKNALADAEHAVALDPNNPAALHELALLEAASGLTDRAAATSARRQKTVERIGQMHQLAGEIEAHPSDPEPHYQLGRLAAEAGTRSLAVQSYRAALAIDPRHQASLQGLRDLGEPIAPRPDLGGKLAPAQPPRSGPP